MKCNKTYFATEEAALFYIEKLKKTSVRDRVPRRAYLCQNCLKWHLTSSDSKAEFYLKKIAKLKQELASRSISIQKLKANIVKLNSKLKAKGKDIKDLKIKLSALESRIKNQEKMYKK